MRFAAGDQKDLRKVERTSKTFQETVQFHTGDIYMRTINQEVLDEAGRRMDLVIIENALRLKLPLDFTVPIIAFAKAREWDIVAHYVIELGLTFENKADLFSILLCLAVEQRDYETVIGLFEMNINVNKRGDGYSLPLSIACENNDIRMIDMLIDKGANAYESATPNENPFAICARRGFVEALDRLFVKIGWISNFRVGLIQKFPRHPLYVAAAHNQLGVMKYLFDKRETKLTISFNPYEIAYINGHEEAINLLLEREYPIGKWSHLYARFVNAHLLKKLYDYGLRIVDPVDKVSAINDFISGTRVSQEDPGFVIDTLVQCGALLTRYKQKELRPLTSKKPISSGLDIHFSDNDDSEDSEDRETSSEEDDSDEQTDTSSEDEEEEEEEGMDTSSDDMSERSEESEESEYDYTNVVVRRDNNINNDTPLMTAIRYGWISLLRTLLDRDVTLLTAGVVFSGAKESPFDPLLKPNGITEALNILLEYVPKYEQTRHLFRGNHPPLDKERIINQCYMNKAYLHLPILIEKLNVDSKLIDLILFQSVYEVNAYTLEMLLKERQIDPNKVFYTPAAYNLLRVNTMHGSSLLRFAVILDDIRMVRIIMKYGGNPDKAEPGGVTAFQAMVNKSIATGINVAIVQEMWDAGYGVMNEGCIDVLCRFTSILFWLLSHPRRHLDENMIINGMSLLDIALKHKHQEAIRLLKGFGARYYSFTEAEVRRKEELLSAERNEREA
jgi:ankyrin repeat protein